MSISERFYQTFIFDDRYLYFLDGLKMTIILTLGSFLLGSLIAIGFCFLSRSNNNTLRKITNVITGLLVQLPTMVMLMIFVYIIFGESGFNVIMIVIFALTLKASAYLSEIFETAIAAVDPGEVEAARTLGMTKSKAFFNITLPQAVTAAKPLYMNQFISTMQETSVVGYLAIMDLTKASSIVTARTLDAFFCLIAISIIYLILGYIGQWIISFVGNHKHIGGDIDD